MNSEGIRKYIPKRIAKGITGGTFEKLQGENLEKFPEYFLDSSMPANAGIPSEIAAGIPPSISWIASGILLGFLQQFLASNSYGGFLLRVFLRITLGIASRIFLGIPAEFSLGLPPETYSCDFP